MRRLGLFRSLGVFVLILASFGIAGAAEKEDGKRKGLPEIDRHSERPVREPRSLTAAEQKLVRPGKAIQYEERLGVPTFLWAAPAFAAQTKARAVRDGGGKRSDVESEARRLAKAYASIYGLEKGDIDKAKVAQIHDTGKGAIIVRFQEEIGGVEVFREELSVMMDRSLEPIALSGYLSGAPRLIAARAASFQLDEREAAAIAVSDRTGGEMTRAELLTTGAQRGPYGYLAQDMQLKRAGAPTLTEPVRYKKVYFRTADAYEPAYYLEVMAEIRGEEGGVDNDGYAYVVSATDGQILWRHNQTVSDNFTYRLWADTSGSSVNFPQDSPHGDGTTPHPTGTSPGPPQPPFIGSSLRTLSSLPSSGVTDAWLPATATETVGNNVDAYIDRFGGDGFQPLAGDFRAPLSSAFTFDYTFDPNVDALANSTQQKAATTSLFYIDNFLHDFFYPAGFNEAAGNAQTDNFGRGGIGNDSLRAEAQDGSGLNNANMSTPADGGRPRQQMYVWSGPLAAQNPTITVNSQPPGGTLTPSYSGAQVGTANFGKQAFDVTANVVRAIPNDACGPLTNAAAIAGNIAFVDRGGATCPAGFATKAFNAAAAGAVGVIIANIASSNPPNPETPPAMGFTNPPCPPGGGAPCDIAIMSLGFTNGEAWRAALALGAVNARMSREFTPQRDGSVDAHVVSHEWGHYISNRLIANSSGLGNQQGRGMGEGWGDFVALLTTVREEDASHLANVNWAGAFPLVPYAAVAFSGDPYYFGIRRLPYSTNMNIDPLTFKNIEVPIVFGGPINPNGSPPSEVHNTGEIWTTMLWECFASLLNNHPSFEDARERMTNYIVAAMKMTPANPTFTEARDAVLAAAFAGDPDDHALFCAAFAKRGIGTTAVSPDRFSNTNTGVVESFECENFIIFQSATLGAPTDSCDADGYLDNVETAKLTVTYKNVGGDTLNSTTATITSDNPFISFSNGGTIEFPPADPFQTTTGTIDVSMFGATGSQDFYIDIQAADPSIDDAIPEQHLDVRGNADDIPASSKNDNVEAKVSAWSTAGSTNGTWARQQLLPAPPALPPPPFNYAWHSPDQGSISDIRLTSPVVQVPDGGTTFTFRHRYSFEQGFDGGAVETSIDGGTTWQDIAPLGALGNLVPGYTFLLATGAGSSPLAGRPAFSGNSTGYPAMVTVTGTLGPAFGGKNVMIRFRAASDAGVGGPGWDVDDINFPNIGNTPFSTVIDDTTNPAIQSLQPAHAWIGLKSGNNAGLNVDILAEVLRNGVLIGSGQVNNVSAGGTGFGGAIDRAITLAMSSPGHAGACTGDTLSFRLSVRVGATGPASGAVRLWYNDPQAASRFGATVAGSANTYYLLNGFVLGTSPGPVGQRLNIDKNVNRAGGNPWVSFGTWTSTF